MRRFLAAIGFAVVGISCSPGPVVLHVPFEEGDTSALVAVKLPDEPAVYWAVDASLRGVQPVLQSVPEWVRGQRIEVSVSFFSEPLTALRLCPGRVTVDEGEDAERLPQHRRRSFAVLQDSREPLWETIGDSETLDAFRVRVPRTCRAYEAERTRIVFEPLRYPRGFVLDEDGEPWVVTVGGGAQLSRVGANGLEETVQLWSAGTTASLDLGEGRYALAGSRATYSRIGLARPRGEVEVYASKPIRAEEDERLRNLAVDPAIATSSSTPTFYGLSRVGSLERIREDGWETLGEISRTSTLSSPSVADLLTGGITSPRPGEVFVTAPGRRSVWHYADGALTRAKTDIDEDFAAESDAVLTMATVPGVGTFLGTLTGKLLLYDGEIFGTVAAEVIIGSEITVIEPIPGGALVGAFRGLVDQYYPGGYCEDERILLGSLVGIRALKQVGDSILVAGSDRNGGDTEFFLQWLRPRAATQCDEI